MPEPCSPVRLAASPPSSARERDAEIAAAPARDWDGLERARAGARARPSRACPPIWRMAGRTKARRSPWPTPDCPGSPNTGTVPLRRAELANVIGLPGRMSTSQRCCSAPSRGQRLLHEDRGRPPTRRRTRRAGRSRAPRRGAPRCRPAGRAATPEVDRLRARLEHLGHQRVRVGVGDLPGPDAAAEVRDLVPGGQDPHPRAGGSRATWWRPTVARTPMSAGPITRPGSSRTVARTHVLAAGPDVVARGARPRHAARPSPSSLTSSCGIDRVRPVGQRRAGEDAKGLAGLERRVGHVARGHAAGHAQAHRTVGAAPRTCRQRAARSRPSRSSARAGCRGRPPPARRARGRASRTRPTRSSPSTADAREDLLERLLDRDHDRDCIAGGGAAGLGPQAGGNRSGEERPVPVEEPPAAQDEQREEAGGDEELGEPDGKPVAFDTDGKTTKHPLEEDRRHPMKTITTRGLWRCGGRPVRRLRRYDERDQPAHDEDHPGQGLPGLHEEPPQEEARLHRARCRTRSPGTGRRRSTST